MANKIFYLVCCITITGMLAGVPAYAQHDTDENPDTAVQTDANDDDTDWGWIGLIGLAGLLGLRRKDK
ncbi:WGxxGxxG family protein [Jeotgalibacillus soli]|uniref:Uncharacterized protein n=1 Tax=Jeotgalibacillus soli TaxID=889306 RepID=A0A0C2RD68_9BACL|nr:WGxxGxxG family protein [Jeotgalibacillus soli]KIL48225.1 hypothetical protein KP78_16720 [Jeotgalibacillus soli]